MKHNSNLNNIQWHIARPAHFEMMSLWICFIGASRLLGGELLVGALRISNILQACGTYPTPVHSPVVLLRTWCSSIMSSNHDTYDFSRNKLQISLRIFSEISKILGNLYRFLENWNEIWIFGKWQHFSEKDVIFYHSICELSFARFPKFREATIYRGAMFSWLAKVKLFCKEQKPVM